MMLRGSGDSLVDHLLVGSRVQELAADRDRVLAMVVEETLADPSDTG
jgi:hypothetical protein